MRNKTACCFGHRVLYHDISCELQQTVEMLITQKDINTFLTGGMGEFDLKFASTVRVLKKKYANIKLILVKPYFTNELNTNKNHYNIMYDNVIIPDESAKAHFKSAISIRNKWIVTNSDIIISYICHNYGGAFESVKYAQKIGREVINIATPNQ